MKKALQNKNVLEDAIFNLIRNHRFYSKIILKLKRHYTTKVPTAQINIVDGVSLYANPLFFADRTLEEKVDLLKHEVRHLAENHFEREKELSPDLHKDIDQSKQSLQDVLGRMKEAKSFNIAEDIAINQGLHNLPNNYHLYEEDGSHVLNKETGLPAVFSPITVEDLKSYIPNVKDNMPMEYYYGLLKKNGNPEGSQDGNGATKILLDDHGKFGNQDTESNPVQREIQKAIIKKLFNEAAAECSPGEIPAEMQQVLEKMNNSEKDWRKDIGMFAARYCTSTPESTRRRRNRRYKWKYPGTRYEPKLTLVVVIDSSGSVYDEALRQFLAEIDALAALGIKIIVVHCDCRVNYVGLYEPNEKVKVNGRGGTSFKPAFELIESKDFKEEYGEIDGLIYLTDGEDFDRVDEPNYPVLWALMEGHKSNYEWGEKTYVKVDRAKR